MIIIIKRKLPTSFWWSVESKLTLSSPCLQLLGNGRVSTVYLALICFHNKLPTVTCENISVLCKEKTEKVSFPSLCYLLMPLISLLLLCRLIKILKGEEARSLWNFSITLSKTQPLCSHLQQNRTKQDSLSRQVHSCSHETSFLFSNEDYECNRFVSLWDPTSGRKDGTPWLN